MNNVQHVIQIAAVGTERIINEGFAVGSLKVDNPSGMWLYVVEAQEYVPPETIGWLRNITPPINSIHIQYVNSLVGGKPSTVTGGPMLVTNYAGPQLESYGVAYSAATTADVAALQASIAAVQAAVSAQDAFLDAIAQNTQAIQSGLTFNTITLTTVEAVILTVPANEIWALTILNNSSAATCYIGETGLATGTTAWPMTPQSDISFILKGSQSIYGKTGAGTCEIRIIYGRIDA